MRKNTGENWPSEFSFENFAEKNTYISEGIIEESYKELGKIFQKEHRKNKIPKKAKQAWL